MAVNIPTLPDPGSSWVDKEGRPTTEFFLFMNKIYPALEAASSAVQDIPTDSTLLHNNQPDVLTKGFSSAFYYAGNFAGGTYTPDYENGNLQYADNSGAHNLARPADDCSIIIRYVNTGTPGFINFTGFSAIAGAHTLTAGKGFFMNVVVINGAGLLTIIEDL